MDYQQVVNQMTCFFAMMDAMEPINDNDDALDVMTQFFRATDSGWTASSFVREMNSRNINILDVFEDMVNADQNNFEHVSL